MQFYLSHELTILVLLSTWNAIEKFKKIKSPRVMPNHKLHLKYLTSKAGVPNLILLVDPTENYHITCGPYICKLKFLK